MYTLSEQDGFRISCTFPHSALDLNVLGYVTIERCAAEVARLRSLGMTQTPGCTIGYHIIKSEKHLENPSVGVLEAASGASEWDLRDLAENWTFMADLVEGRCRRYLQDNGHADSFNGADRYRHNGTSLHDTFSGLGRLTCHTLMHSRQQKMRWE